MTFHAKRLLPHSPSPRLLGGALFPHQATFEVVILSGL